MAMLDDLQSYVDEMNKSSSVNAKRAVLEKYKDNEDVKKLLFYTYNPYLKYGVTSKNILKLEATLGGPMPDGWPTASGLFELLNDLAARRLTGHDAVRAVH